MNFKNPIEAESYTSDDQIIKFANPTDTDCKEIMFNPGGCVDCGSSSSSSSSGGGNGGSVSWDNIVGKPSCFPACLEPLDALYVRLDGSYADPDWITSLSWSKITNTPTTLAGYGITDAVSTSRTININGVIQDLSLDRQWRTAQADTGVFTFGGFTVASGTTIDIGAATGVIVDNETTPSLPTHQYVSYPGATNVTVPIVGQATYVFLTSGNTIAFQSTFPTSAERKEKIWLGKVSHPNGVITVVVNEPDYVTSPLAFSRDMFQAAGPYINNGVYPYANGANLTMNITGGFINGDGINFAGGVLNRKDPNRKPAGPGIAQSFSPRTQIGGAYPATTILDVANYDVGGVITAIPGGGQRASLKYFYAVPSAAGVGYVVQYGQQWYNNIIDAIAAVGRESQIVFPNLIGNSILIGVLVARKDATALNNLAQGQFFPADKFGQIIGATSGVSTGTLQTAYNNSTVPQIVLSALGPLTIRNSNLNGGGTDTEIVQQWQNIAGTTTASVTGAGTFLAATNVTISPNRIGSTFNLSLYGSPLSDNTQGRVVINSNANAFGGVDINYGYTGGTEASSGKLRFMVDGVETARFSGPTNNAYFVLGGSAVVGSAKLHARGIGTSTTTFVARLENQSAAALLTMRDDGQTIFGQGVAGTIFQVFNNSAQNLLTINNFGLNIGTSQNQIFTSTDGVNANYGAANWTFRTTIQSSYPGIRFSHPTLVLGAAAVTYEHFRFDGAFTGAGASVSNAITLNFIQNYNYTSPGIVYNIRSIPTITNAYEYRAFEFGSATAHTPNVAVIDYSFSKISPNIVATSNGQKITGLDIVMSGGDGGFTPIRYPIRATGAAPSGLTMQMENTDVGTNAASAFILKTQMGRTVVLSATNAASPTNGWVGEGGNFDFDIRANAVPKLTIHKDGGSTMVAISAASAIALVPATGRMIYISVAGAAPFTAPGYYRYNGTNWAIMEGTVAVADTVQSVYNNSVSPQLVVSALGPLTINNSGANGADTASVQIWGDTAGVGHAFMTGRGEIFLTNTVNGSYGMSITNTNTTGFAQILLSNNLGARLQIMSTGSTHTSPDRLVYRNIPGSTTYFGGGGNYVWAAGAFGEGTAYASLTSAGLFTSTNNTITAMTLGSVLFAGTGGAVSQDNTVFFWDNTNKRLGLGMALPTARLQLRGGAVSTSTYTLWVENGPGTSSMAINDSNEVKIRKLMISNTTPTSPFTSGTILTENSIQFNAVGNIESNQASTNGTQVRINSAVVLNSVGASPVNQLEVSSAWAPSSGSTVYNNLYLNSTIAQDVTATGISRNLYVNTAITRAYNYRAFEFGTTTSFAPNAAILDYSYSVINPTVDASVASQKISALDINMSGSDSGFTLANIPFRYGWRVTGTTPNNQIGALITNTGNGINSNSYLGLTTGAGRTVTILAAGSSGLNSYISEDGNFNFSVKAGPIGILEVIKDGGISTQGLTATAASALVAGSQRIIYVNSTNGTFPAIGYYQSITGGWVPMRGVNPQTTGSVLFAGASGEVTQDNANFFWDNTIKRLQIKGTAASYSATTAGASIQALSDGSALFLATSPTPSDPVAGISVGAKFGLHGDSTVSNFFGIGLGAVRNTKFDMWFQTGTTSGGGYRWYIGTTERMTMTSLGNIISSPASSDTAGTIHGTLHSASFTPASGSALFNGVTISPTINQTVGVATGLTRGLYISATNTNAHNYRAIQIDAGTTYSPNAAVADYSLAVMVHNGNNTAINQIINTLDVAMNGNVGGFAGAIRHALRLAGGTMQVASLGADPNGQNGDIYYSTALGKFRGFENGAWKSFTLV